METKTHAAPSFTVSLRGYDREEVDEYLDSLAEALAQVEEAEERARRLQAHVARCNARIKELEDRIRTDTPRSGVALGERIGLLLREAEEAAAATVARAESDGARIIARAEARFAEADEVMRSVTSRAEEQARRIEAVARGEAAEIVSEAEARATARTRQIEQWAEQVVSHTRAEEARVAAEQARAKADGDAGLRKLAEHRKAATATLIELREMLGRAVGLIEEADGPEDESSPTEAGHAEAGDADAAIAETTTSTIQNGSTAGSNLFDEEAEDEGRADTGEIPSAAASDDEDPDSDDTTGTHPVDPQFEAKLDAWVAGDTAED
jgi:DivIVA domain-containing protein